MLPDCIFTTIACNFYCDIKLVILSILHPVASSSSHCFMALTPWFVLLCKFSLVLARPFQRTHILFLAVIFTCIQIFIILGFCSTFQKRCWSGLHIFCHSCWISVLCFQKTVLLVISVFKVLSCTWKLSFWFVNLTMWTMH